jgi:hypothetical protein
VFFLDAAFLVDLLDVFATVFAAFVVRVVAARVGALA